MNALKAYATVGQYHNRRGTKLDDRVEPFNTRLAQKLRTASRRIDEHTSRSFQPEIAARKFDYIDSACVLFENYELLSLTSITDGQGLTVSTSKVSLYGNGPYYGFELNTDATRLTYNTTKIKAITVTGVWGWHDDYANAWHDTGLTVQGGGINSSTTSITLSGNAITSADVWGQIPAISIGALIQVDTEWMQVVAAASTSANTITVARGQNGSTAASHAANAAISVYEAPMDVRELCLRWAAYLEAQDSNDFDKSPVTPMGGRLVAPGLPMDIEDDLMTLRRQPI